MKPARYLCYIIAVILTVWTSSASACSTFAWTYGIDMYDYIGSPALTGTVPGATYTAKVAAITNDSNSTRVLEVDLYYGALSGHYQYSPNEGANWINIPDTTTTWVKSVSPGTKIWLRVILTNDMNNTYHILSPSPWGNADHSYGEDYYFAYPPGAHYYAAGWVRDIAGYVAVVLTP